MFSINRTLILIKWKRKWIDLIRHERKKVVAKQKVELIWKIMVLFKSDDFGCYQNGKFACYQMQNSWYSSPSKTVKKHIEKKKKKKKKKNGSY